MSAPPRPEVLEALVELEADFPGHAVRWTPDGGGGAHVAVEGLPLGEAFVQATSTVHFAISALYPDADVYPHYLRADLARSDGAPLTVPLNPAQSVPGTGEPAVMLSRRSNHWDPNRDTASLKLQRVLAWLAEQAPATPVAA